jgi:hypothetical protein
VLRRLSPSVQHGTSRRGSHWRTLIYECYVRLGDGTDAHHVSAVRMDRLNADERVPYSASDHTQRGAEPTPSPMLRAAAGEHKRRLHEHHHQPGCMDHSMDEHARGDRRIGGKALG